MPLNFSTSRKWLIVGLVSIITFVTPFASTILSPGISSVDAEFDNPNTIVGTMTVSIYLLGYVIGPLFLAPLSEIYGRKPVLGVANLFFCVWQIGCALAPNLSALIVFRFFCGLGGVGGLVSSLRNPLFPNPPSALGLDRGLTGNTTRPSEPESSATSSGQKSEASQWASIRLAC